MNIKKSNNRRFKFFDLFAGIGGIRLAFKKEGGECVFSSEIEPWAVKTYKANFGDTSAGDIKKAETLHRIIGV